MVHIVELTFIVHGSAPPSLPRRISYGLGMQRETCYPSGGRQTPALGLVLVPAVPNQTVSFNLAAGEGGAANTLHGHVDVILWTVSRGITPYAPCGAPELDFVAPDLRWC